MAPFGDLHEIYYIHIKSTMPLSAALDSFRNSAASVCLPLGFVLMMWDISALNQDSIH